MSSYQHAYNITAHALQWLWGLLAAIGLYLLLPIIILLIALVVIAGFIGAIKKGKGKLSE